MEEPELEETICRRSNRDRHKAVGGVGGVGGVGVVGGDGCSACWCWHWRWWFWLMLVRWNWSSEGNVSRSIASKWDDSHAPPGMVV